MKISPSLSLIAATIIAASSIGYSAYTAAQVRDLDHRLHRAETLLQAHAQSLADAAIAKQFRDSQARVQKSELLALQAPQFVGCDSSVLEQRVRNVEQQTKPHLEVLPPYVPDR
jgi:hypothetical protein